MSARGLPPAGGGGRAGGAGSTEAREAGATATLSTASTNSAAATTPRRTLTAPILTVGRSTVLVRWHNLGVPDQGNPPNTSLRAVVEQLGALVLRHDAEGRGDVTVTGVVIDDRTFGAPLSPG